MIQTFLLCELYMILSALLLLIDYHRSRLSFLLRFRAQLQENGRLLRIFFLFGIAIAIAALLLPVPPGPMVLGDLIPSLATIILAIYVKVSYSRAMDSDEEYSSPRASKGRPRLGYGALVIAILHFILPSFVLI